jgi:hypothetical protein
MYYKVDSVFNALELAVFAASIRILSLIISLPAQPATSDTSSISKV